MRKKHDGNLRKAKKMQKICRKIILKECFCAKVFLRSKAKVQIKGKKEGCAY